MNIPLAELMNKQEELDHELVPYLEDDEHLGKLLKHPLVFAVPYLPQLNALNNAQLRYKMEAVAEALAEKNYGQFLALHERPYRWEALYQIEEQLSGNELADQFSWVWTDSENIWQHQTIILALVERVRRNRQQLMSAEDRATFKALRFPLTVYRGCQEHNRDGMSWTLEHSKAEWFSRRYSKNGFVMSKAVKRQDVLFYTNERNEAEIVLA